MRPGRAGGLGDKGTNPELWLKEPRGTAFPPHPAPSLTHTVAHPAPSLTHTVAEWLFGKCCLQTYFSYLHYVLKLRFREQGGEGTVNNPTDTSFLLLPHCPQDPPGPGKPTTASKEHCSAQTLEQHTLKISSLVPPPSAVFPYPAPPREPLTVQLVKVADLDHCPLLLKALLVLAFQDV